MLVDDDIPVLEYLSISISWESLGLAIIAQESSSLKALEQFERLQPDIVLTDIGLPQMDGLELAGRMKELRPDTAIVFLTCHEDFQYAKQAVKLNAIDYLIKDELAPNLLKSSLAKTISWLKSAELQRGNQSYREDVFRNKDLLKQAFSERMMNGGAPEDLLPYGLRLGIGWREPDYLVGAAFPFYSTYSPRYSYFDPLARYGMYNIAEELSEKLGMVTVLPYRECMLLVFNYKHSLQNNSVLRFRSYMEELQTKCREYIKIDCGLWYDSQRYAVATLGNALRLLLENRLQGYYSREPVIPVAVQAMGTPPPNALLAPLKEQLLEGARTGNKDTMNSALDAIAEAADKHRPEPAAFLSYCLQLVRSVDALRLEADEEQSFAKCLQHTLRLYDTIQLMRGYLNALMEKTEGFQDQPSKDVKLQEIDRYIAENIACNISSIDVAEYLCLNPSYFSRYFKKMTGINFTDYVHRFKMSLAVNLLDRNESTIETVTAQLGYSDRNYFTKVFKKYIGIAPGEFKKKGVRS